MQKRLVKIQRAQVVSFKRAPTPDISVEQKLAFGFVRTLVYLQADNGIVRRLWQSFWTAIKRGLGVEMTESEDITGVKVVAEILGISRANADGSNGMQAGSIFEKAKLGLEPGTSLEAEFNRTYVDSAAKETSEQQKKQR